MNSQQSIHTAVESLIRRGVPFARAVKTPWVDQIESGLGFALPEELRVLITHYTYPRLEIGGVDLFSNLGDGSEEDMSEGPIADQLLYTWLRAHQRIQIGRYAGGSYDPVCLGTGMRGGKVERYDHEDILMNRKNVKHTVMAASLLTLLQAAA